ncbi:helicase HerA-like domain-containing protein [Singulisphaera sp. Ch08]|uniref:Helicase HerA-like domain-containing protein n=1 Tax=Singulisphaera sp. Ch08 TaxID=3120278 RepID=A0AAU7C7P7_9BACT
MGPQTDARIDAFCSPEHSEVFHAIASRSDIWKDDPFDVETIHEDARTTFQRLVHRATSATGPSSGRILLLQGEAGSGKTHLMRAFRNWAHTGGRGYCGYMQMTSSTGHYGRYVLNNLIDSLDQTYDQRVGETSGLMRLSTMIAESPKGISVDRVDQIRNDELEHGCLAKLVDALADQVVMDDRFNNVDIDLVRALLFLQANDPRVKSRVLKYLRCEKLSDHDRFILGGMVARDYDDAPQWLIQRLGELMANVGSVPLILCVDQLEDIYNLDEAPVRFRRAMATLCDLVSRTPSAIVVISCLEEFYTLLKGGLTKSLVDRIEKDPAPIQLKGTREEGEIVQIVSHRLRSLFDSLDAPFQDDDPTFPFRPAYLQKLAGMRTRDVLERCQEYRERCIAAEKLVDIEEEINDVRPVPPDRERVSTTHLEQAWNDFRSELTGDTPTEDPALATLLAEAIRDCSNEIEPGHWFETEADKRFIAVESHAADNSVGLLVVGVCNGTAKGGYLGRLITEVVDRAGENRPVIVRSTDFPANPNAAVSKQIGELITHGGRRVVVEDSDWRTMAAFRQFRKKHHKDPVFSAWLKEEKPLSRLKSLRAILDLDHLNAVQAPHNEVSPVPPNKHAKPVETSPAKPVSRPRVEVAQPGPIAIGTTNDRAKGAVTLESTELTRHAAFLGGTGSGKTTVALSLIEQLLLRGIPAILVDRKGDLSGYASEAAWSRPLADAALAERRQQLRDQVEIAVYTPGNPNGRPLSIAIAPAGLGQSGSFERSQISRYAASALAGMMNYGTRGTDPARQAILANAIELLAQLEPGGSVSLPGLIEYIAEKDAGLVNAVGRLDTRLFERLVQDLETLRLSRGDFLAARGEPIEAEALFGLGRHGVAGKTRLSVISTKFLGATQDVQFWVSQLLVEMSRWSSRSPSSRLQAILMFDEADLYLPATRQPPTKEPMEALLKRARSAGLGLLLATQSPGDFDYKCRDNIRTWFVGRVKEPTALAKMKPMLSDCRVDVTDRLATQDPGEFHLLRDGAVTSLRASLSAVLPEQLPEDEILRLARQTLEIDGRRS